MRKILLITTSLLCVIAATIGLFQRQTYTNITAKADYMDHFKIAILGDGFAEDLPDFLMTELPNAKYIVRVKAKGKVEHLFEANKEQVEVLEVYKGNDIHVGNDIFILHGRFCFNIKFKSSRVTSVELGFVNFMKKGDEYLVFLDQKAMTANPDDNNNYPLFGGFIIAPIFNYEDKENNLIKTSDDNPYVPYKEVRQNEFFVRSNERLQKLENLKHNLIKKYPKKK